MADLPHLFTSSFPRPEHISSYIRVFTALVVFHSIGTVIYNVFFHPLRKYPGPRLAAATNLVWCYYTVTGQESSWTQECHEKYGEVVRLGSNRLSYIHPQAWKDIFGPPTGRRQENPKDPHVGITEGEPNAPLILNIKDIQAHSRVRKIFSNAFSNKALRMQEPLICGHINKLIQNIAQAISENPEVHLDGVKLYNCATFDIMGDLTFGEPLGMLDTGEYTPWVKAVFEGLKLGIMLRVIKQYPWIERVGAMLIPQYLRDAIEMHHRHSAERVDRRLKKGSSAKPDIWKLVLEKEENGLSLGEMHNNAELFMLAGTETTAALLSGLTFLLLKNPDKMNKLIAEIRALSLGELSFDILSRLPFLNACIEEGLRYYPPAPIGTFRLIPKGGNSILGEWVPEGTRINIPHHSAFNSSLNFKNPNSFEPERWLPHSGYDSDRKEVFHPFSLGPRNCLGKNLAYREMQSILANVLWHFDLELCFESESWIKQKVYGVWEKPPLWIKARPA